MRAIRYCLNLSQIAHNLHRPVVVPEPTLFSYSVQTKKPISRCPHRCPVRLLLPHAHIGLPAQRYNSLGRLGRRAPRTSTCSIPRYPRAGITWYCAPITACVSALISDSGLGVHPRRKSLVFDGSQRGHRLRRSHFAEWLLCAWSVRLLA